jgi:hypothetical protein
MIEASPKISSEIAHDSDPLDETLHQDGIEMIAPHRSNRSKPPTQDGRRLSRYLRRWLVERFFAIQWQRRILVRWEYHPQNFLGFVQLACLLTCSGDFEIGSNHADVEPSAVTAASGSKPAHNRSRSVHAVRIARRVMANVN